MTLDMDRQPEGYFVARVYEWGILRDEFAAVSVDRALREAALRHYGADRFDVRLASVAAGIYEPDEMLGKSKELASAMKRAVEADK